jgi:hypothetical protein
MKKFEDLFIDSQRKLSAPVGGGGNSSALNNLSGKHQRDSMNPFSAQPSTILETANQSR